MTRKDYELIASIIRELVVAQQVKYLIAQAFAIRLSQENQHFDSLRFLEAAMKEEE